MEWIPVPAFYPAVADLATCRVADVSGGGLRGGAVFCVDQAGLDARRHSQTGMVCGGARRGCGFLSNDYLVPGGIPRGANRGAWLWWCEKHRRGGTAFFWPDPCRAVADGIALHRHGHWTGGHRVFDCL